MAKRVLCLVENISGLLTSNVTRVIIRVELRGVLVMQKKLTVTIDEEVYDGLRAVMESEALEWTEGTIGDLGDEER
jgi:hypothetical protein